MSSHGRKSQCSWALAGAVLLVGACSEAPGEDPIPEDSVTSEEDVEEIQQSLTSAENTQVKNLQKDMGFFHPQFKVKPIIECVDRLSTTKYVAHFGYVNSTTTTKTINVGSLNRFFPNPQNRGQPSVFSPGTKKNQVQVPFNGSLLLWGLDGFVAAANKDTKKCAVPPPSCPTACDDHNPCTSDVCNASTGFKCVFKPLGNGTSCADGNACNGEEVCTSGKCTGGHPLVCQSSNPCTTSACVPASGCVSTPKPDGTTCPVSGNCGAGATCQTGQCTPSAPPACDDNNPCTADTCGGSGCSMAITKNVYFNLLSFGTITFKNNGPAPASGYKVEFDIAAGKRCTTSYVPPGATLSPLTGTTTTSNHCVYTWTSPPPLAVGASISFLYTTNASSMPVPTNVVASCLNGGCTHTPVPVGSACGDSNFCNGEEVCNAQAQCRAPTSPDCNDNNPCTVDSCLAAGGCGHVPGNDGGSCRTADDKAGKCDMGVCTPSVVCPDDGNPCTDEVITAAGVCTHPTKADDTTCSDGNACTQLDVCRSGVCTGTTPVVCGGATACRQSGTCDPGTGLCVGGTPLPDQTACDDNSLCTTGDACLAGSCRGAPVVCTGDACHDAGTCNPLTGACFNPNKPNGAACNDGLNCTVDRCTDGVCTGSPVVCTARDACHEAGTCDQTTGVCTDPASPDGKQCNDGRNCTTADACTSGVCGGSAVVCPAPSTCHLPGTCQESTGQCDSPVAPDGSGCSDGNLCTRTDSCVSGACAGSNPVQCQPGNQCQTAGVCSPSSGACSAATPKPVSTQCNDGIRCTTGDHCDGIAACVGTPLTCSAGQACRESTGACANLSPCETCESAHVISGECDARIGCGNITTGAADVALCTALRDCMLTTKCWASNPLTCLCGTASEADCLTAAANGDCKAEVMAAAKTTDPERAATYFYDFATPAAYATQQIACDLEFCSAVSTPPSTACPVNVCPDDGNPCTKEVVVNGVCTHPAVTNGTSCSDANACTQVDTCQSGSCVAGPPVQCAGASACTLASTCDPGTGVCIGGANAPNGTPCSDGVACTSDDKCTAGTCGGTAVVCEAPQTCNAQTGVCEVTCADCLREGQASGICEPGIGCANLANATDRALCEALHTCMITEHCATTNPFVCFCGPDTSGACLGNPQGVCKQAVFNATKTTDPALAGGLFYDLTVPAGFATQEIACRKDACPGICPL